MFENTSGDEELYLQATNEVDGNERRPALWAKATTLAEGDEGRAKYIYINQRVEQLTSEGKGSKDLEGSKGPDKNRVFTKRKDRTGNTEGRNKRTSGPFTPGSIPELLLSAEGKISRQDYNCGNFGLSLVSLSMLICASISDNATLFGFYLLSAAIFIIPGLALGAKRSRDRGRSGGFAFLLLIPLLNFWPIVELVFLRATLSFNRGGPYPLSDLPPLVCPHPELGCGY